MSRMFAGQKWDEKHQEKQDDRPNLTFGLNNDEREVQDVTNYYTRKHQPER